MDLIEKMMKAINDLLRETGKFEKGFQGDHRRSRKYMNP